MARLSFFAGLAPLVVALPGCIVSSNDHPASGGSGGNGSGGTSPIGPVAHDANEAWPDAPSNVPVLGFEDIVRACVEMTTCNPPDGAGTNDMVALNFCVSQIEWSAERAIPVSNLAIWNERAEYVVTCELSHIGDCTAQKQCWSGRDPRISCQEDGCRATAPLTVTCDGSIAHIAFESGKFDRDCAHAYAECDATSPTGCTDRHFSVCPADGNQADHCDGNVRLGCDGAGQVSYHDCARMGGTCGASAGKQDCVYVATPDAACSADPDNPAAHCVNGNVTVCMKGKAVSVSAPSLCPAA